MIENQLDHARAERHAIASRLREGNVSGPDTEGLAQRLSLQDVRIIEGPRYVTQLLAQRGDAVRELAAARDPKYRVGGARRARTDPLAGAYV